MTADPAKGRFGASIKGRISALVEDHLDQTKFEKFNNYFPKQGYQVEYLTHLWGQSKLRFSGNPDDGVIRHQVTVTTEVNEVRPADYRGIVLIGAYAMDCLRYQPKPRRGEPNRAPAVEFLRHALATPNLKIGTVCHSIWLFCADKDLLKGRRVTCAHNTICDVENAGAEVVFD